MGWFNKRKKKEEKEEIPRLPELPTLPKLPEIKEKNDLLDPIHQLPRFPTNSLGEKFSQNTIKDAVTGKKEEEVFEADDFATKDVKLRMMQKPPKRPLTKKVPLPKRERIQLSKKTKEIPKEPERLSGRLKEAEPIFIRIDKFEESLKVFEKTKDKISEIEKILRNTKKIKEEEEKELEHWENEIKKIKEQIEKIDEEIFSKIE